VEGKKGKKIAHRGQSVNGKGGFLKEGGTPTHVFELKVRTAVLKGESFNNTNEERNPACWGIPTTKLRPPS